jgi:hypothetical protein
MLQSFILCLALLFIGSCGSESKFITSPQGGYIETQQIPPDYVKCRDSFYWNTMKFEENASIFSSTDDKYAGQMNIMAGNPINGHTRSGTQSKMGGSKLPEKERLLCYDIFKILSNITSDNQIYQFFEYKAIKEVISSNNNEFKELEEKSAVIDKFVFDFDDKTKTKIYKDRLIFPVSVTCEKKWSVKRDPTSTTRAIFKEPEGRCNFSSEGHELKLLSGEKVLVALSGYYEADPKYPDKRILVMIERYGFKH